MGPLRHARVVLSIFVYFPALTLGAGIFVLNPARVLLVVPILTGIALLGHAVKRSHLDELGRAIVWLWAALLAFVVGGTTVEVVLHRDLPPLVDVPVARVLGTVGLVTVLATVYARGVRRTERNDSADSLPG